MLYLILASGMLFYALTRLEEGGSVPGSDLFWYVWLAFTAIIIAANVNILLFMSESKRNELARIKKEKARQWERALEARLAKREERDRRKKERA